jgi:hypothetical protein
VTLKIVLKAASHILTIFTPKAGHECTREKNLPIRAKESRNRNLMRLSHQALGLLSFFNEASRKFIFIILLKKAA